MTTHNLRDLLGRAFRGLGGPWERREAAEVFPWLEQFATIGIVVGALLAAAIGPGDDGIAAVLMRWTVGAMFGGILGVFLGMQRSIAPPPSRAGEPLWDRWLDTAEEELPIPMVAEPAADVALIPEAPVPEAPVAEAPLVRPRVISHETGDSLPIEDEVVPLIRSRECEAIRILGPAGSGKTTALRYLESRVPYAGVEYLDDPDRPTLEAAAARGIVVYASEHDIRGKRLASFRLAPWGVDEWIEYLLAADAGRCASVMSRLKTDGDRGFLRGIPELWRIVLDRMGADETFEDARSALRAEFESRLVDPAERDSLRRACLDEWSGQDRGPGDLEKRLAHVCRDPTLARLLRHPPVQLLIAADRIVASLEADLACDFLKKPLPIALIRESSSLISKSPRAVERLKACLSRVAATGISPRPEGDAGMTQAPVRVVRRREAMAASLLHAAGVGWQPADGARLNLSGAYLDHASWPGIDLNTLMMNQVDFSDADLCGAHLDRARLNGARFARARLREVSFEGVLADEADFQLADLAGTAARAASFRRANFERANLAQASLQKALLEGANLRGAGLRGACLAYARLDGATIKGAVFRDANLEAARLGGLTLGDANFAGARFGGAILTGSNLEGMDLPGADFEDAKLGTALLTGSRMPGANFLGAYLRSAGLAEIHWPNACLRDADLRGATFHLGSSRSGLVQSPIACEGSRTGFYTDEFHEQDFKSPEEIRKANLCGADLRGADVEDVDFYLVDLRGARFSAAQERHFRRCGAILDAD